MAEINLFFEKDESEWLDALPKYQKDLVSELLATKSHEEAALAWLEASVDNTSPFTGQPQPQKKYFTFLKEEIHKLLCGNPVYADERNQLVQLAQSPQNKTAVVSVISALIGAKVGLAATFVAPAIVIILMMIGKTSLNAWCSMQSQSVESAE